jgi:Ca2+/Na+ antiporter
MLPTLDFDIPWEQVDNHFYGFLIQILCMFYSFIGLAIVCDEHMVPSLDTLCHRWGIGEDVAGATFMAFGSAAPEIIINVVATIQAQTSDPETTSLGISAILGSGMIAFSLIPAACGLCATSELHLKRRPLLRDELFYLSSLGILIYIIHDGVVHVWEAGLLLINYTVYLSVIVFASRVRQWYWENVLRIQWTKKQQDTGADHPSIQGSAKDAPLLNDTDDRVFWREHLHEMGFDDFVIPFEAHEWDDPKLWKHMSTADFEKMGINKRGRVAKFRRFLNSNFLEDTNCNDNIPDFISNPDGEEEEEESTLEQVFEFLAAPLNFLFDWTCLDCELGHKYEAYYLVTFFVALIWVSLFSFILSSVVERWVHLSGLPMVFFGLLLVSLGAEIPDTIESVTVARKGYGSMAVSNCQGNFIGFVRNNSVHQINYPPLHKQALKNFSL